MLNRHNKMRQITIIVVRGHLMESGDVSLRMNSLTLAVPAESRGEPEGYTESARVSNYKRKKHESCVQQSKELWDAQTAGARGDLLIPCLTKLWKL